MGLEGWAGVSASELKNPTSLNTHETASGEKSEGLIITDTTIKNETMKREVKNLNIQAKNAPENIRIHPRTINLTVLGPPSDPTEDESLRNDIFVYIDMEKLTPGIYVRPARIILPEEYIMIDATPEIFVIEIKPEKDAKR